MVLAKKHLRHSKKEHIHYQCNWDKALGLFKFAIALESLLAATINIPVSGLGICVQLHLGHSRCKRKPQLLRSWKKESFSSALGAVGLSSRTAGETS